MLISPYKPFRKRFFRRLTSNLLISSEGWKIFHTHGEREGLFSISYAQSYFSFCSSLARGQVETQNPAHLYVKSYSFRCTQDMFQCRHFQENEKRTNTLQRLVSQPIEDRSQYNQYIIIVDPHHPKEYLSIVRP